MSKSIKDFEIVEFKRKKEVMETEPLKNIVGENIVIENFIIKTDKMKRDYAVILTVDGKMYRTYSEVIMNLLKTEIKPLLDEGKKVKVSVRRVKNYYVLDEPIPEQGKKK